MYASQTLVGGLQGCYVGLGFGTISLSSPPQRCPQNWVCLVMLTGRHWSHHKRRGTTERKVTILATDQTLRCRECGRDFVFTAGEQEFYASKGLMNTPSRCPECRAARKSSMSGGSYGGERAPRQMYTATCSSCGGEARVPFQPRGDKPVYCSNCFQQIGGGARSGSGSSYGSRW